MWRWWGWSNGSTFLPTVLAVGLVQAGVKIICSLLNPSMRRRGSHSLQFLTLEMAMTLQSTVAGYHVPMEDHTHSDGSFMTCLVRKEITSQIQDI